MNLEVSFSFSRENPRLEDVSEIIGNLIGFLRDQGIQHQKFLDEVRLAATEAVNNAIEHGCVQVERPFVEVTLSIQRTGISLKVADPSAFAGWTGEAKLPDDPLAEGGRGRFLIEQMTDRIEHFRRATGYVLVLYKNFDGPEWSYEPGQQEQILDSMTEEVGASYEMINALIGLGELVASASEMSSFLQLALQRVCELTGAETAYVRMNRMGHLTLIDQAGSRRLDLEPSVEPASPGVEAAVFETGEEVTVINSGQLDAEDPLRRLVEAVFVAPIFFKNERMGVLVLAGDSSGPFFTAAQLKVARVVGEYLGIVSAMNELQQRRESEQRALNQLEIAAEIQMSLLPQDFQVSRHLDIFGICRPALRAGGDYFDLITLPDGALFVVVADVMGKGLSAALFANMLRTSIRAQIEHAPQPGELLKRVNRVLAPDLARLDMFITVDCAWISSDGGEIRKASAGHPPGIVFRKGRELPQASEARGMPIGVLPDQDYETESSRFETGDGLLLFTDGIPEADDQSGRFFEIKGITDALLEAAEDSAEGVVKKVMGRVDEFSRFGEPTDDRTAIALIRKS